MKGEVIPRGQTWQGNPASMMVTKSLQPATFDRAPVWKPVGKRSRSAERRRKTRIVPWRRTPEPQQTIADAMAEGATPQRQLIVEKIMAPANSSGMFNDSDNG